MTRIYLDACCIIYLIEASSPFHDTMRKRLEAHGADPASRLVTSRLSRLECRTRPLREADTRLLVAYDAFFGADRLVLAEIGAGIVERATDLRARYRFRTPDAIHLATAIDERVDLFLTNDAGLLRCSELRVEMLRP
ncbi:MAG: PIN domain-containing protein [Planctomycetes bacterium]|nr:PIN domain-containing protein [Planctomycetota bacterium]